MEDLALWLEIQISKDEQVVGAVDGRFPLDSRILEGAESNDNALMISYERMAAECASKRKIVSDFLALLHASRGPGSYNAQLVAQVHALAITLEALALPYADRAGYRAEWRQSSA